MLCVGMSTYQYILYYANALSVCVCVCVCESECVSECVCVDGTDW